MPWNVRLSAAAARSFRSLCEETVEVIADSRQRRFTADSELNPGEVFLLTSQRDRTELEPLREIADQASSLPPLSARELDARVDLYGIAAGDRDRAFFVRRTDPRIGYQRGRFIATFGERLKILEEPTFSFAPGFDLVLTTQWTVIVNQAPFERLFRETGIVDRHIEKWISSVTENLPMEADNARLLREVARTDSRLWRRLREIHHRGHLKDVSLSDVKAYAKNVSLDPNTIVQDDRLVFNPEDRFSFVHLLNEDLYRGVLTNSVYEAQRKADI